MLHLLLYLLRLAGEIVAWGFTHAFTLAAQDTAEGLGKAFAEVAAAVAVRLACGALLLLALLTAGVCLLVRWLRATAPAAGPGA